MSRSAAAKGASRPRRSSGRGRDPSGIPLVGPRGRSRSPVPAFGARSVLPTWRRSRHPTPIAFMTIQPCAASRWYAATVNRPLTVTAYGSRGSPGRSRIDQRPRHIALAELDAFDTVHEPARVMRGAFRREQNWIGGRLQNPSDARGPAHYQAAETISPACGSFSRRAEPAGARTGCPASRASSRAAAAGCRRRSRRTPGTRTPARSGPRWPPRRARASR